MKNFKTWKSISATLLAATLVTTTSTQVLANDTVKVETPTFETVNLQEALKNVKDENVSSADLEVISSVVPVGYLANNIFVLSMNLEKITNPNAKEALTRNIERAIARWEAKQKLKNPIVETPKEEVVVTTPKTEPKEEAKVPAPVVDKDAEKLALKKAEYEKKKAEKLAKIEAQNAAAIAKAKELKAAAIARAEAQKAEALAKAEAYKAKKEAHKAKHGNKHEEHKAKH
ncbi:MAG: hypothetical protein ABWY25_05070, partial [Paenisporosarcina sp.]